MATRNIVPRADGEGGIGTVLKKWGAIYADSIHTDAFNLSDDAQIIGGDGSDSILIPYEETINDAIIWGLPIDPKRGLIFCDVDDVGGDFTGLVTASAYPQISLVDLDIDSMIQFGFTADDKPTVTLRSGAYYSLFQQSQAEGLVGADTRLGLDESNRIFIICDRGDINNDFGLSAEMNPALFIFNAAAGTYIRYTGEGFTASNYGLFNVRNFFKFQLLTDISSGHFVIASSIANVELTDDNGRQAWMYLEPKINQALTGAADAFYINMTLTAEGDGSTGDGNNFINLAVAGASKFRIDNTGGIFPVNMKSGANQGAAGAAADELWWDTNDDTIKMGV